MDRNATVNIVIFCIMGVALRKESVDRNSTYVTRLPRAQVSLSARRAWIEIDVSLNYKEVLYVALRKESVDRNPPIWTLTTHKILSLSARRAWIEMGWRLTVCLMMYGRSPQGERG